jgi:hypothetical protein
MSVMQQFVGILEVVWLCLLWLPRPPSQRTSESVGKCQNIILEEVTLDALKII